MEFAIFSFNSLPGEARNSFIQSLGAPRRDSSETQRHGDTGAAEVFLRPYGMRGAGGTATVEKWNFGV